jgi:hypothetical protein
VTIRVELGNPRPQEVSTDPDTGAQKRKDLSGPAVTYFNIPSGFSGRIVGLDRDPSWSDEEFQEKDAADVEARKGLPLYTHPLVHDDSLYPEVLAGRLKGVDAPAARRAIVENWLTSSQIHGLPNHEAFQSIVHPAAGAWVYHSAPDSDPSWVSVTGDDTAVCASLQHHLALHYGCAEGRPGNVEDTHVTQYGSTVYPAGASPDPLKDVVALHTSWGRDIQSLEMFGWGYLGAAGTATATSSTSLTGSSETGVSHASNDSVGNVLVVSANASGTGAKVYGVVTANTSGTTPVYTVDQWYNAASPGGGAGSTPNATSFYQLLNTAASAVFTALSTNTTTPSLGGTGGTQDAATITQTLTSEITTSGGGLVRKIAPISHTAGAATVVASPVFTANGTDSLPVTVGKAAQCISAVATVGALTYITLVSPTATLSSSGDSLSIVWTWTMT